MPYIYNKKPQFQSTNTGSTSRPLWDAYTLVCQLRDTIERWKGPVAVAANQVEYSWDRHPHYLKVVLRGRSLRRHLPKSVDTTWIVSFQIVSTTVIVEIRRGNRGANLHWSEFDLAETDSLDRLERWVLEQLAACAIASKAQAQQTSHPGS